MNTILIKTISTIIESIILNICTRMSVTLQFAVKQKYNIKMNMFYFINLLNFNQN